MKSNVLRLKSITFKLSYNEHARERLMFFVRAVIRYNRESLCTKVTIYLYLRYSREFDIIEIVIAEFDYIR